jgi:hypothetical protein
VCKAFLDEPASQRFRARQIALPHRTIAIYLMTKINKNNDK